MLGLLNRSSNLLLFFLFSASWLSCFPVREVFQLFLQTSFEHFISSTIKKNSQKLFLFPWIFLFIARWGSGWGEECLNAPYINILPTLLCFSALSCTAAFKSTWCLRVLSCVENLWYDVNCFFVGFFHYRLGVQLCCVRFSISHSPSVLWPLAFCWHLSTVASFDISLSN